LCILLLFCLSEASTLINNLLSQVIPGRFIHKRNQRIEADALMKTEHPPQPIHSRAANASYPPAGWLAFAALNLKIREVDLTSVISSTSDEFNVGD
jgi:hypothetical protein